jgi:hypothetical protein
LYPNPTTEEVSFISNTQNHHINSVVLINSLGQQMKNIQVKNTGTTLEIHHGKLNSGIYFVQLTTDTQQSTYPLIVK